ncbi:hypothetical protein PPYR_14121 [Photinus pyralis]|uniref:Glutathione-dependent dehydroascorbate reductase n=1 Tax=Photinus pyralis TaxID=7054 RepID=A0A1Y1KSI9_PHOPY|nr:pyrimidodiazepine synthase-like [Photinus pyralis]KAB0792162.1 hypothetical protein PPYR_14121 [Photinus pyralis]
MSAKHLATGSEKPPKVEGKLRLYSMEYCPYAHRVRLVLLAKNVPHDIVNLNLINKPEWYKEVHPEGKVPALDIGSKIVVESLDIADYLDEHYPDPPLYPAEPPAREQDKELMKKFGPLGGVFSKLIAGQEKKSAKEWLDELTPHLQVFEDELKRRNTTFFGGDNPGMVDYMLWPWGERAGTVAIVLGEKLPVGADDFKLLRAWMKTMRKVPVVDSIHHGPEKYYKTVLIKTAAIPPDYDSI